MSVFRESLVFFNEIGLYDVVLPFLLVFTLVFGVLEKSKIFGTEGKDNDTKKNLNAMVAFCVGFFVVASVQLVAAISEIAAYTALILVMIVMFMLLVGAMHEQQGDKGFKLGPTQIKWFTGVIIAAMILIFLNGFGWLGPLWEYVMGNWNQELVATILLFGIIVGFMVWVTSGPKEKAKDNKDKKPGDT